MYIYILKFQLHAQRIKKIKIIDIDDATLPLNFISFGTCVIYFIAPPTKINDHDHDRYHNIINIVNIVFFLHAEQIFNLCTHF